MSYSNLFLVLVLDWCEVFVSHNFHVRKENALHPSKAGRAILDEVTTELFLTLVLFPK